MLFRSKPFWVDDFKPVMWQPNNDSQPEINQHTGYDNIPLVVAPGHEEEFLAEQKRMKDEKEATLETEKSEETRKANGAQNSHESGTDTPKQTQNNENGWSGLLSSVGLNGLGDIGKKLGYVISMLPDVLVGLFTGKTKSLRSEERRVGKECVSTCFLLLVVYPSHKKTAITLVFIHTTVYNQ